jgi:hypothetical protein
MAFAKVRNTSRMFVSRTLGRGDDQGTVQSAALNKVSTKRSIKPTPSNASGENPISNLPRSITTQKGKKEEDVEREKEIYSPGNNCDFGHRSRA